MMKQKIVFLLLHFVLITSCKQTKTESTTEKDDTDIQELFALMQGSFNSERQSLADSTYYNISLHMYPIWKEKGNWLYVEQAMNSMQDKPYRQRVYEIKRNEKGQLASYVYTIPNDSLWIGKWKTPETFNELSREKLVLRKGCEVLLTKKSSTIFFGKTQNGTCASTLRGASYAMSAVEITSMAIKSWDQGFNSEGKQVWGATEGGYIFDKLKN